MKMKEVIELCQADVRYSALKTGGEKKQALAEYQVRYGSIWIVECFIIIKWEKKCISLIILSENLLKVVIIV